MLSLIDTVDKFNLKGKFILSEVVDNNDPKKLHRIKLTNPLYQGIPKDKLPWATRLTSAFNSNTNNTAFYVPNIGDKVIAVYLKDIYHPFYFSLDSSQTSFHLATYPDAYGLVDSYGNKFYIDRKTGDVHFEHPSGMFIHIYPNGDVKLHSPNDIEIQADNKLRLLANNHILIQSKKVDINP